MKQVVQELTGRTSTREVPAPIAGPGQVVVANVASVVSAGTERYVIELAKKSLLGKALDRPDHVKRVLQKLRSEGLSSTLQQVRAKLDEPMALGYSSAGVVLECGRGVTELKPGDRVATAGPHAAVVSIGKLLCARLPDGVNFEQGAFAGVATIGLEGVRLARAELGSRVLVIGLGLIGQICVALLKAQGCRVFGVDVDASKLELARSFGADEVSRGDDVEVVRRFSGGEGVDAVVITAATESNRPIELAAEVARPRGRIVLVGVVGLELPRPPFFQKELEFTVSGSLGPGRWDPAYEEQGRDYPFGQVRWTAQRNMQAVLDLIAAGKLPVDQLTSHRFPIEDAAALYDVVARRKETVLGAVLSYTPDTDKPRRRVDHPRVAAASGALGYGLIGVGNFARLIMLPELGRIDGLAPRGLCSAHGLSAETTGSQRGFAFSTTDATQVFSDPQTTAVFIATRHDLHARLAIEALRAGKHVFVEKPLCITLEELAEVTTVIDELGPRCPILTVGFNRRFATATGRIRHFFAGVGPVTAAFRFSVPSLPSAHWTHDEDVGGGRIVGEACHAIDTVTALVGAPPVRVYAESVAMPDGARAHDDSVFLTLRHQDGSVSSVSYQAGGDRGLPAERLEVFGGGRVAVLEGWQSLELWSQGRRKTVRLTPDKGHRAELEAFVAACREGGPWPIAWDELRRVSAAALLALRSLRDGQPQDVF